MFFEQIKNLDEKDFIRTTGIKRNLFIKMVEVLTEIERKQKYYGGRKNKYSIEDRVVMTLKYWKEYPTFFQMSLIYNMSRSSCHRNIIWVENNLADHPDFQLPAHNKPLGTELEERILIIDATEVPVERPKKTSRLFFW